jgi:hypothetical protein
MIMAEDQVKIFGSNSRLSDLGIAQSAEFVKNEFNP